MPRTKKAKKSKETTKPEGTIGSLSTELKNMILENKTEVMKVMEEDGGVKFVKPGEFKDEVDKATADSVDVAAKELGLDLGDAGRQIEGKEQLEALDLLQKISLNIDMVMRSVSWRTSLSQKEKTALFGIKVACRQILNEPTPPGQPSTIAELIATSSKIPPGVLDTRGKLLKPVYLRHAHLEAAGIVE